MAQVLSRGVLHRAGNGVHLVFSPDTVLLLSELAMAQISEESGEILDTVRAAAEPDAEGWEEDEAIHDVTLLARLGVLALAAERASVSS